MTKHELLITPHHGRHSTSYVAECEPCNWTAKPQGTEEAARREFQKHVEFVVELDEQR